MLVEIKDRILEKTSIWCDRCRGYHTITVLTIKVCRFKVKEIELYGKEEKEKE